MFLFFCKAPYQIQTIFQCIYWSIKRTISSATIPYQHGPESNGNNGVFPHSPDFLNRIITNASKLLSYSGYPFFFNGLNPPLGIQCILNLDICLQSTGKQVGDCSRGWPEGSLFNSYYTATPFPGLLHFTLDSTL